MKKTLCLVLALIISVSCICQMAFADGTYQIGDANESGSVDSADVLCILRFMLNNGNFINFDLADVNHDLELNSKDVLSLRKFLAKRNDDFGTTYIAEPTSPTNNTLPTFTENQDGFTPQIYAISVDENPQNTDFCWRYGMDEQIFEYLGDEVTPDTDSHSTHTFYFKSLKEEYTTMIMQYVNIESDESYIDVYYNFSIYNDGTIELLDKQTYYSHIEKITTTRKPTTTKMTTTRDPDWSPFY